MGGDSSFAPMSSSEEELLIGQDFPHESLKTEVSSTDQEPSGAKLENDIVINGDDGPEFLDMYRSTSFISEAAERRRVKVYADILMTYDELMSGIDRFEEAKSKILSYKPGSWAAKTGGMDMNHIALTNITSLVLVGPNGSGKSSLVNKICRVLEDGAFVSGRAQVSYNSSAEQGTYFLRGYVVPRGSGSFCLYDTRSLSFDSSENTEMFKRWMAKGVRDGELIRRKSDSKDLKALLKCKAQRSRPSSQFRAVNFVIFVVNGLSILESMDSDDEKKQKYCQMIATNFNNPLLSFKDDKPAVVVTHGDLLSCSDRVRIRVYLGELLGVPPTEQIFDIPENNNPVTKLAIVDMLIYCLERADRNLHSKGPFILKELPVTHFIFWMVIVMVTAFLIHRSVHAATCWRSPTPPPVKVEWRKIRHLWLG